MLYEKNQLIVNIVDSSKIKPKVQNSRKQSYSTPKIGKANQSLPDPNISSISENRQRHVRPASINMNHSNSKEQNVSNPVPVSKSQHAVFNAAHKLPRSPRAVKGA
jgi:ribosomal protein S8